MTEVMTGAELEVQDKQIRDALMRLRRLFTAGKWTKGLMRKTVDGENHYCLVGGIREVTDYRKNGLLYVRTKSAVRKHVPENRGRNTLTTFNDTREEVGEVIDVIDKAIADLEGGVPS